MNHSTEGFDALLRRAQTGDRSALELLLQQVQPWLRQQARSFADPQRPDASASDLAQDAWLRAWQKLAQFRGGPDDEQTRALFYAWLGRIVQRVGLNAQRARGTRQRQPAGRIIRLERTLRDLSSAPLAPPAAGPTPSGQAEADERLSLIRNALERLDDALDRDILRLRFFDGLSLRQIAERLEHNHEKVRQRFHTVLRRLERELKGLL